MNRLNPIHGKYGESKMLPDKAINNLIFLDEYWGQTYRVPVQRPLPLQAKPEASPKPQDMIRFILVYTFLGRMKDKEVYEFVGAE